jgi:hypothetical protein
VKLEVKFENVCLGLVTAAALVLLYEGALFLRAARLDFAPVSDTLKKTNALLDETTRTEQSVFSTTAAFSAQLASQSADWQKSQLQVYKTITDTKEILVRTDKSLNDVLVPRLRDALDASTALQTTAARNLTETTTKIDETIESLQPIIANSIQATAAAAAAMSDPAIHGSLDHFDAAAGNLEGMSADGKRITADAAAFVHRELAPARGIKNTIKAGLDWAYKIRLVVVP